MLPHPKQHSERRLMKVRMMMLLHWSVFLVELLAATFVTITISIAARPSMNGLNASQVLYWYDFPPPDVGTALLRMSSSARTAIITFSSSSLSEEDRSARFPFTLRESSGDEGPDDEGPDGGGSLLIGLDDGDGLQSSARESLLVAGGWAGFMRGGAKDHAG